MTHWHWLAQQWRAGCVRHAEPSLCANWINQNSDESTKKLRTKSSPKSNKLLCMVFEQSLNPNQSARNEYYVVVHACKCLEHRTLHAACADACANIRDLRCNFVLCFPSMRNNAQLFGGDFVHIVCTLVSRCHWLTGRKLSDFIILLNNSFSTQSVFRIECSVLWFSVLTRVHLRFD